MSDTLVKFLHHPMLANEAFELGITEECKKLVEEGFLEFKYSKSYSVWSLTPKGLSYLNGDEES